MTKKKKSKDRANRVPGYREQNNELLASLERRFRENPRLWGALFAIAFRGGCAETEMFALNVIGLAGSSDDKTLDEFDGNAGVLLKLHESLTLTIAKETRFVQENRSITPDFLRARLRLISEFAYAARQVRAEIRRRTNAFVRLQTQESAGAR